MTTLSLTVSVSSLGMPAATVKQQAYAEGSVSDCLPLKIAQVSS